MRRAALLLCAPLALAACGGSGGSSSRDRTITGSTGSLPSLSATGIVNQAIAKGTKVPVHAAFTGVVTTSGQQIRMSGSGDVDSKTRQGSMRVTMGLDGERIPFDEVLRGDTVYASSEFFQSFLPSGKKWLEISLSSASNLGAAGFALTSQPGAVPPLQDVRSDGGGKYSGRVDEAKLTPAAKAALKSTHVAFGAIDVWVGGDGYVRRVRIVSTSTAGGAKARAVLTTTLSHYGETVHVTIPPASETVNANKLSIPGFSS